MKCNEDLDLDTQIENACEQDCFYCCIKSGVLAFVYGDEREQLKELFPNCVHGIHSCYMSDKPECRLKKCGASIINDSAYEFISKAVSLNEPNCFEVVYYSLICLDIIELYRKARRDVIYEDGNMPPGIYWMLPPLNWDKLYKPLVGVGTSLAPTY